MTAVTGVRAHQTMLDVTGNNISNANTTGFKKDNTLFADLMYQASKYASSADGNKGGINPAQVGLGVSVAAIETIHTQGSSSYTGNPSDMMIQDRGFFVYTDGSNQLFSRSGACTLDGNSDLVQSGSGYKLQGYKMEETALEGFQQAAELSTVNIPLGQKMDAKKTTRVDYQCNLDSRSKNFLSYGFADLPYNAVAGAEGLSEGRAKVPMNGVEYDMSFSTSFAATVNDTNTGTNYLTFGLANGGETTNLTFDMTSINSRTGLPMMNLPTIVYDGTNYTSTAVTNEDPTTDSPTNLVGWLDENNNLVTMNGTSLQATVNKITNMSTPTQDTITSYYKPVYRFPGQTPPKYFTASYDDDTGLLQIRTLTLADADNNEVATTLAGLRADLESTTGEQARATHVKVDSTVFNYDVKSKMDYANFTLSGAPTITTTTDNERVQQEFNFIAEFEESNMTADSPSDLGKTVSKMVLWYYGYSNGDAPVGTAEDIQNGTATDGTNPLPKSMHKMEANVFFNADGSFDRVDWNETDNSNAPLGFRILSGTIPGGTGEVGPNFQITAGTASSASTKSDALNFMVAQTLDSPATTDQLGSWNTIGTTAQGGYHATKATIYDDDGKEHTLEVTYKKITENRWRWEAFIVEQDESGNDIISNVMPEPRSGEIEFDGSGRISNAIADGSLRSTQNAEVTITIPFSLNGQPNSDVTLNFGGGVGSGGDSLLGVTQFASETTTKPVYQDGYTMGILKNYSVAANGMITGSYSNGISIPLYRVALATFANEQGLEKVGNTMFQASVNSGTANIDGAGSNGKGSIMGQYVEMSNVDLTEEFTHLIIAQRGFQANTRVVTVSDQILEEVVNLKR